MRGRTDRDRTATRPARLEGGKMENKIKRRFGDRSDGRRLRTLTPLSVVSPYIMVKRNDASNYITVSVDIKNIDRYIRRKNAEGLKGFGMLHVILAAYVRTVAQRPGINRFIAGQRIFARNDIQVMMAIKKEMRLDAQETVIKCFFTPYDSPEDIFRKMNSLIEENRALGDRSDFDSTARILKHIPGVVLKFAVWFLNLMDYFGLMPKFLLKVSPFHGSFFITSMGSLGIPAIYHHLYNFGNVPVFCSYSAKRSEQVVQPDGEVEKKRFIDLKLVMDERICDGHYYSSALKKIMEYLKHPDRLDMPVAVIKDID